jgi:hypothetical protein
MLDMQVRREPGLGPMFGNWVLARVGQRPQPYWHRWTLAADGANAAGVEDFQLRLEGQDKHEHSGIGR